MRRPHPRRGERCSRDTTVPELGQMTIFRGGGLRDLASVGGWRAARSRLCVEKCVFLEIGQSALPCRYSPCFAGKPCLIIAVQQKQVSGMKRLYFLRRLFSRFWKNRVIFCNNRGADPQRGVWVREMTGRRYWRQGWATAWHEAAYKGKSELDKKISWLYFNLLHLHEVARRAKRRFMRDP